MSIVHSPNFFNQIGKATRDSFWTISANWLTKIIAKKLFW
jgi:uncharacterized membrane protein YhaH (DUF805 family)